MTKTTPEEPCKWKRESRTNEALMFNGYMFTLVRDYNYTIVIKYSKGSVQTEKMLTPLSLTHDNTTISAEQLAQVGHDYLIQNNYLETRPYVKCSGRPLRCLLNAGFIKLFSDLGYTVNAKKNKAFKQVPFIHVLSFSSQTNIIEPKQLYNRGKALLKLIGNKEYKSFEIKRDHIIGMYGMNDTFDELINTTQEENVIQSNVSVDINSNTNLAMQQTPQPITMFEVQPQKQDAMSIFQMEDMKPLQVNGSDRRVVFGGNDSFYNNPFNTYMYGESDVVQPNLLSFNEPLNQVSYQNSLFTPITFDTSGNVTCINPHLGFVQNQPIHQPMQQYVQVMLPMNQIQMENNNNNVTAQQQQMPKSSEHHPAYSFLHVDALHTNNGNEADTTAPM